VICIQSQQTFATFVLPPIVQLDCFYYYCCCQMRSSVTWMRSRIQHYLQPLRHYKWTSKAEFTISCIGYCIGFGNLWRFPYIAHKNGGGAFILSYTICMLLISLPMFYLECLLGQFTGCNAIAACNYAPVCKGIGYAMMVVPIYVCLYYSVLLSYSLKFIFLSFAYRLPWELCDSSWGADSRCDDRTSGNNTDKILPHCSKWTNKTHKPLINIDCHDRVPSSEQYWQKAILHLDEGTDKKYSLIDIGIVQWDLVLAVMVCWLIQYIVISRGIKSITKVAYFTTVFSFIIIACMVANAIRLNGSLAGLAYLFKLNNFADFASTELWVEAIAEAFFSTGICLGCIILYSSYNRFQNKIKRSVFFILFVDFAVNILSAVTIFSVLGYISEMLQMDIKKVVDEEPGLIFVVMPEAVSKLPFPQFWSLLYFLMFLSTGINSQAAQLDAFLTSVHEQLPRTKRHVTTMRMIVCSILFSLSIPFTTNVSIREYCWKHFLQDLEFMTKKEVSWLWSYSWRFVCPVLLIIALVVGIAFTKVCENYNRYFCFGGWFIFVTIIIQVPIGAAWVMVKNYQNHVSVKQAFKPIYTWGPRDVVSKVLYLESQMQRGIPLGKNTTTGLAELEAEGPNVKASAESRIKQRKYSVFYRFSNVFMPDELEELERDTIPLDIPSTSK
uniref:Transporter n=1 Tax=Strigamia maritima TaxID=126957 RepID=T1IM09_STRMM